MPRASPSAETTKPTAGAGGGATKGKQMWAALAAARQQPEGKKPAGGAARVPVSKNWALALSAVKARAKAKAKSRGSVKEQLQALRRNFVRTLQAEHTIVAAVGLVELR